MSVAGALRRHGLPLAAAAAVAASFALPVAAVEAGPVLCLFRRLTGLPCPACGLTRSFVATAHGQFDLAFAQHLFGPLLFAGCIALVLAALARRLTVDWWRPLLGPVLCTWLCWGVWRCWGQI